jgi:hypothetical protein
VGARRVGESARKDGPDARPFNQVARHVLARAVEFPIGRKFLLVIGRSSVWPPIAKWRARPERHSHHFSQNRQRPRAGLRHPKQTAPVVKRYENLFYGLNMDSPAKPNWSIAAISPRIESQLTAWAVICSAIFNGRWARQGCFYSA